MGSRLAWVLIAALAGTLTVAPAAQATFHEIYVREVYPGSALAPNSGFVELQMYAGGQTFVGGQSLKLYDAAGTVSGTFTFGSNVSNGASQQTILLGDDGVDDAFGVTPDLVNAGFTSDPAGGAACWAGTIDCVAWGAFGGSTPSPAGSPAVPLGIPDGEALRRTIAPGCATLLELGDDSSDSATDLTVASPQPRNNGSAIVEQPCTGPTSTIDGKPSNPTNATSAAFTYHASAPGASFECMLDATAFVACEPAGTEYGGPLADGSHTFQVQARSETGTLGGPSSYSWRVDTAAPVTAIDTHPADPSPGNSSSFTFHASEAGVNFKCSLALGAAPDSYSACTSGKTYLGLADGSYAFKVKATDAAANEGEAAAYTWTVDHAAADSTPPDTLIDSGPPDPSESSSASFAYHATEPESTFECKLDGAPFSPCAATGITYDGLADGPHAFQVRATDPSANTDATPAGRSFSVVAHSPLAESSAPAATPPQPAAQVGTPPRRKKRHHRKRCRASARGHGKRHRKQRRCKRKHRRGATASTFHLVMVREAYPGSAASPGAEYVELQMYASGQGLVNSHRVEFLDTAGSSRGFATVEGNVALDANQSTILLATPEAESQFGLAADGSFSGGKLDPAGGAVCWETLDCLSWGGFSGATSSPGGAPADPSGIPDGMALRRAISPGCPTLLDPADDSDGSAADFADAFPAPRPNSVVPSERACASGAGGGEDGHAGAGGGGGSTRLQTRLRGHPGRRTGDRTPTFRFSASRRGATFLCRVDRQRFRRCPSPFTTGRLRPGAHIFRVKARLPGGAVDRSPATWRFRVVRGH